MNQLGNKQFRISEHQSVCNITQILFYYYYFKNSIYFILITIMKNNYGPKTNPTIF